MSEAFSRIKTTPCPVTLKLADGSTLEGIVWLLPDASRASGVMAVEALLDGPRDFIAVGLRGQSALVQREAIRVAEIEADGVGASDALGAGASLDVVTLHLDSGETVSGVLTAVSAEGKERMSDVFNAVGRFVPLLVGNRLSLVARKSVVRVSF